jgi:hypothetical protein
VIRFIGSPAGAPLSKPIARTGRKIALCGSYSLSLEDTPWEDPSWEFWGHASSHSWYRRQMDRYFDLHVKACWTRGGKKGASYPQWLKANTVPIYMQEHYPEVPASVKYPKGRVLLEFSDARGYFTNHAAWMIALALTEGVSVLGLFGVNYSSESEYMRQRGSCEYWLGRAAGMGVRVILPEQCTLLREPGLLYGYDSHDKTTGVLRDEYKPKVWTGKDTVKPLKPGEPIPECEPPSALKSIIAQEEAEYPRPEWAMGQVIGRTDGGIETNA